jgi:glutamine amidotransferase-like uncharacterized protein
MMEQNNRINVLVYSGAGTGELSRAQTLHCLRTHLGSNYAVQTVCNKEIE